MPIRTLLLLTPLVAAVFAPRHDARCTFSANFGFRTEEQTVLLARPLRDTVAAGPGGVTPSPYGGHFGSGAPGPIYGQLFDVHRFAGADSALLARTFAGRGSNGVAIVPWDYDPSCRPSRWTRTAAWVDTAHAGTFVIRLRPDSLWLDGLPVFDAFAAAYQPYRTAPALRRNPAGTVFDTILGPAQYFDLLIALPTVEQRSADPDGAWHALLRWQQANPHLAQRYPAPDAAFELEVRIRMMKASVALRRIRPSIAGTYRVHAALDDEPERTFYVRTRSLPTTAWHDGMVQQATDPLDEPPPPSGYSIIAAGAASLEALPVDCTTSRRIDREGYMYAIEPAEGQREWRGWIESGLVRQQFPADSALARFSRQSFEEWSARRRVSPQREAPAHYALGADGTLRFEQITRLEGGATLSLRGERLTMQTLDCRW